MLNVSKLVRRGQKQLASRVLGLASLVAVALAGLPAEASVPLTRAGVEALRNRVEFIPRGRTPRAARMSDILAIGDALRTAQAAQADLRFNDGSLARVGERATFRFVPNTRNFRLNNGTVLLLIPPGQGRTNIQTPSAVTGIQGSAVVVRYIPESDLTLVMALTNNPAGPMTITAHGCGEVNADCGPSEYALYGGQMALIQNNQVQVVEFDLPMFYQTSPLVEGLELDNPEAESPLGDALEQVREEILEALEDQSPFSEESVTLNPAFISVDGPSQVASDQPWLLSPAESGVSPLSPLSGTLTPGDSLVTTTTLPVGEPQPGPNPEAGGGSLPNPGGGSSAGITGPGATPTPAPDPTPAPPPAAGGTPSPGPGVTPTPTPDPTPAPPPAAGGTPSPGPTLPTPDVGFGDTPAPEPPPNQPPAGGADPGTGGGPGGGIGVGVGVGDGGGGSDPGGGSGPGNAEPPPFNDGVPANPPAEPEPFFPPDK